MGYLPLVNEKLAAAMEPIKKITPSARGKAVLLAEDASALRRVVKRMLLRLGYTVFEAGSGAEDILLLKEPDVHIDILITDLVMPGMGGEELASELLKTLPNLKILFMSGYAENALQRSGTLIPGAQLLEKPVTEAALAAKVSEILNA